MVILLESGKFMPNELITANNVNIQPVIETLVELVKDKKATGGSTEQG